MTRKGFQHITGEQTTAPMVDGEPVLFDEIRRNNFLTDLQTEEKGHRPPLDTIVQYLQGNADEPSCAGARWAFPVRRCTTPGGDVPALGSFLDFRRTQ